MNLSIKGLVYEDRGKKAWKSVPMPTIQSSTDAIVKLTSTSICGTDLHILKGDVPTVTPGRILGHEGVGLVQSVGDAVSNFRPGDRVLISCITSCGKCLYCSRNLQAHCLNGGWRLGNEIDGTQAEYVRIPYADTSLYAAPKALKDDELLLLSDDFPTGFEIGVRSAKIAPGETVAVVGAGPVGLAVLITAQFYSPANIIMIDRDDSRLAIAEELGATMTINPTKLTTNSVLDEIMKAMNADMKASDPVSTYQTPSPGVDVAIECVGVPQTFDTCQKIIAPGGRIANIGVHGKSVDLQLQDLWTKNISITTGLVSANTTSMLLKLLQRGKMKPDRLNHSSP
ncbi:chaperonin 10-like protein [Lipomyces chichibuensis]|uniref:chaperonin 10-like protein n=1 Tax=Lipomyces chichibuensis TaxID=1546026 RepID=UPI0033441A03